MSGRRIYEEIKYHIKQNPDIEHIEFLDLLFNGNMQTLTEFCELMIREPLKENLRWHANVVIRPQMTKDALQKMRKSGCFHLTYGIESGSQRVLDLMRKRYKIEDADNVLKYTHEAGIQVTCNFMFGFPGETEKDFQQTLEFLRRNKNYVDVAYPSRTFCTIEPYSYLEKHLEEFSIFPNPAHGQFWMSKDGENTYPKRMKRCEEFSILAQQLGVNVGLGLQTSIEHDRWLNLGNYYESIKDYKNAIDCFSRYLVLDPRNEIIQNKIEQLKSSYTLEEQKNHQISFNWDIHYVCNYRCPYCWFYGKWIDLKKQNRYFSIEQLESFWENIYSKYGVVKIAITGGEPFLYPEFIELIKILSQFHKIEIITNLSPNIDSFIKKINTDNVKVHPSYHPLFADFDEFINKTLKLKQRGFSQNVSYLAWPPQIPKIKYYYDKFAQFGINLFVQSFFGEYKGIRYPDGYSDEEKETILPFIGERGDRPFQTEPLKTKGKLCSAGHKYGVIHPDGAILRCGGINSADTQIGNLSKENFELLKEPSPCTSEICPCNEWAFLLKQDK
jgi:MoaA/NifB/PqqE/SkfB family radical SAM enzyme